MLWGSESQDVGGSPGAGVQEAMNPVAPVTDGVIDPYHLYLV